MDERFSISQPIINPLPSEENVYRLAYQRDQDKKENNEPGLSQFEPHQDHNGKLSVDYAPLTTPEKSLARFGAEYRPNSTEWKNHHSYSIYSLGIGFLRSLSSIRDVIHEPIIFNPPLKGFPDNPAHSFVQFDISIKDKPEIFTKIQQEAIKHKVDPNMKEVSKLVKQYRSQWDHSSHSSN